MTIVSATDYVITVDGNDLSDHIDEVHFDVEFGENDITNFGSSGKRELTGGLESGSVQIVFQQDYAASAVEATIWPLKNTVVDVVAKPASGSVSATNPSYTAGCLISKWSPIAAKVGEVSKPSITWPVSGGTSRATS